MTAELLLCLKEGDYSSQESKPTPTRKCICHKGLVGVYKTEGVQKEDTVQAVGESLLIVKKG